MNDKRMKLIEVGMKLFAEKGYYKTSIQEIAIATGVSKGAFYLYFQSKEDFIATAFQFYYTQIAEQLEKVSKENLPPKASLAKQIEVFTEYIYKYKDFIIMHLRENISIGQITDKLIQHMKIQNLRWIQENICAIYGEKITPYLFDTIIQIDGLLNGYFKWIVVDHLEVDPGKIGPFLTRRIDDIVNGMMQQREEPLVTTESIPSALRNTKTKDQELSKILFKMKTKLNSTNQTQQLHEALDLVLEETNKAHPQRLMIQGMLAHFRRVPELQDECEQIAELLNIELLN